MGEIDLQEKLKTTVHCFLFPIISSKKERSYKVLSVFGRMVIWKIADRSWTYKSFEDHSHLTSLNIHRRYLIYLMIIINSRVVILAPFLLSPIILLSGDDPKVVEAMKCAYLIMLMAVYWMTEALPLPITSMIPMVGLPLLGLMSTSKVAINYLNSTNCES